MVVCQYFLEGRCRFGPNCRYEHPTVPGHHSGFLPHAKQFNDIMLEVVSSERGNQWPLSCYAPIRDRPVVPNLDDTSPEELRQLFHEAQKQGRVEDYINHARQLYNKAQDMRNFLKQPSAELGQLLETLTSNKSENDPKSTFRFSLGTEDKQSIFGNSQPQPPSFAQTNLENQQFAPPGNLFSAPKPNIFGQPTQNTFTQPTGNIFGNPPQNPQQTSVFGNTVPQPPDQDLAKYSTELSEEDQQAYMAPMFAFGKIPQKPPTRSLC